MTRQQYNGNHHIIGTAWFTHRNSAHAYYRRYGADVAEVRRKLKAGECHIGEPPPMHGEVRRYINSEGRWHVVVKTGGEG